MGMETNYGVLDLKRDKMKIYGRAHDNVGRCYGIRRKRRAIRLGDLGNRYILFERKFKLEYLHTLTLLLKLNLLLKIEAIQA